ncbi:MAG TPA: hypothetical protein VK783_10000 [Bacteroidia bacterium]|jgi:hypothetical protein|nr:hypothetical protein [Bacteroidia bacterium]
MDQENTNEEQPIELSEEERNELIWEENNDKITQAVHYLLRKEMKTSITNIARITKLSRPTIYQHFKRDAINPANSASGKISRFMMDEVITRICRMAVYGDLKASRLYLELMGAINAKGTVVNTNIVQGMNAVTVNGHTLTDEMIQGLSKENLSQLEEFIKAAGQKGDAGHMKVVG